MVARGLSSVSAKAAERVLGHPSADQRQEDADANRDHRQVPADPADFRAQLRLR
jgi:hypothetical protein